MKNWKTFVIGALSAVIVVLPSCASDDDNSNGPAFTLQLLHFSDVDGSVYDVFESVEHFATLVGSFKSDPTYGNKTLFVSSGDNIIPGPRYFASESDEVEAITGSNEPGHAEFAILKELGLDASALGNHELDQGDGNLADAINGDGFTVDFPFLSTNASNFETSDLEAGTDGALVENLGAKFVKYAVKIIDGEAVGLVGVSTPEMKLITSPGDLLFQPSLPTSTDELAPIVQNSIDSLTNQGIDKIVLLSHLQDINCEKSLATRIKDVDIIVAGGSGTMMGDENDVLYTSSVTADSAFTETYPFLTNDLSGNPTAIVNVSSDHKYLGRLVAHFDSNGKLLTNRLDPELNGAYAATAAVASSVGGITNSKAKEISDALMEVIQAKYAVVVGYTKSYLDGRRYSVRVQETRLGNLSADANLWYANKILEGTAKVDVSLKNGGGIRSSIGIERLNEAGEIETLPPAAFGTLGGANNAISQGHLESTFRFDNGLVVVDVTTAELKDLLENGLRMVGDDNSPGEFPQVGGMRFEFDASYASRTAAGNGERVRKLVLLNNDGSDGTVLVENGSVLDESIKIKLVSLNFLVNGGDGYPFDSLSAPNRTNLYSGQMYGDPQDFPDGDLTKDPGLNNSFSVTGGEQDAFAEYFLAFHNTQEKAYNQNESAPENDQRIKRLDSGSVAGGSSEFNCPIP